MRYSQTNKHSFILLNIPSYLDPHFYQLLHLDEDHQQEVNENVKRGDDNEEEEQEN